MSFIIKLLSRLFTGVIVLRALKSIKPNGGSGSPAGTSSSTTASPSRVQTPAGTEQPIPAQKGGPGGPDSPLDLQPMDWKSTLKRTLKEIKDDRVTLVAAGMAYYAFLAIFPAIIAGIGILGLVGADEQTITDLSGSITESVPKGIRNILTDAVTSATATSQGAATTAAIIGILVALWSASSAFVALQSGLNIAYDVPQDRKFIGKRAVAFALILATALLGGVPSPFFTFGDTWYFTTLGWVLTIAAVIVLFSIFYFLGPKRENPSWKWVSPGGLVGAVLWLVVSAAFFIYVGSSFGKGYEKTYGALASVVILVLWLFLSSLSILVGGELNAELERQGAARSRGRSEPRRA